MMRLDSAAADFAARLETLLIRGATEDPDVVDVVEEILEAVRREGDPALLRYTKRFDGGDPGSVAELEIPARRLGEALQTLPKQHRAALEHAAGRIRAYHEHQRQDSWSYTEPDGTRLGQQIRPLRRVGLYVPGGKAAYPSTVLMTAVPAQVAGVGQILMCVPAPGGMVNELVLAAASLAGVHRVFTLGGAQAIAAMAYGTQSVPAVDKIVGPGNVYVAAAKRRVFGAVGIDLIAGPSEVLVVCDESVDPEWVAMDLFAQAEHDERAQAIVISTDAQMLDQVARAVEHRLPGMERHAIIARALADHGALIQARDVEEVLTIIDRIAPEHLELMIEDAPALAARVRNAGAIFIGRWSSEALGDYCAGPNHTLPTSGTARFSSPLGVYDFQKRSSVVQCGPQAARELGRTAAVLARAEHLPAHARAAELRIEDHD